MPLGVYTWNQLQLCQKTIPLNHISYVKHVNNVMCLANNNNNNNFQILRLFLCGFVPAHSNHHYAMQIGNAYHSFIGFMCKSERHVDGVIQKNENPCRFLIVLNCEFQNSEYFIGFMCKSERHTDGVIQKE